MEVNALKVARNGLRTAFSLSLKKIETELIKENIDMNQLSILKTQFMDKFQRLDTCQNQISEQLLDTEDAVQECLDDMEDAENYRDRYIEMCTRVDLKIREIVVPTEIEKRSFKLSKIELKKFSGEVKDFLAFWSQFQKIHDAKSIAEQDKRQYLLQSVEPKSKAERLVLSFPATAENYPKAIDQLKERFGREDLLVQIYVRELLNLVMKNAVSGSTKSDLSTLYDELEGKLWSLESLGRTQEKYGDFLTPLVESCLPEEILMARERKRNTETDARGSRTLEHLMTFLRLEVQGEEMVQLAKSGFGTPIRKRDSPTERVKPTELMTASALASSEKSSGRKYEAGAVTGDISRLPDKNCLVRQAQMIGTRLFCEEEESIFNSSHSEEESMEILKEKPLTLDEKLEKAIYSKTKVLYCSTKKSTSFNKIMKQEMQLFDSTENPSPNIIKLCDALKTIPPTSVEAERAFSAAGFFVTKLRTRLNDKSINCLCFLKSYFKNE
ncbi:DUF1758 domain-containing protein [Trichonephila clavipes]|nr:DUF1758 domain-containing protein [Trichonephila clavipes]